VDAAAEDVGEHDPAVVGGDGSFGELVPAGEDLHGRRPYGGAVVTRVGFLGTGFIARFHAAMLEGSGEAFVAGPVFDTDADRAAAFAADHGYTAAGSEEAVLDAVDAVYVTTWTSEHLRLVTAAAERGVHVFCEKPLAVSAGDARAEARRRGARLGNPDGSFLRAIRDGRPAWPSLRDALAAHDLVDACYRSAAGGGVPEPI
jgi:predicted dehydrogenase